LLVVVCSVPCPILYRLGPKIEESHGLKYTYGAGYLLKKYKLCRCDNNNSPDTEGDSASRLATDKHLKDNYQSNL